jgi:hypothetical protein
MSSAKHAIVLADASSPSDPLRTRVRAPTARPIPTLSTGVPPRRSSVGHRIAGRRIRTGHRSIAPVRTAAFPGLSK